MADTQDEKTIVMPCGCDSCKAYAAESVKFAEEVGIKVVWPEA